MYEGILLVDKPSGWTSHDVVAKIRRLTKVKKVGHAGTLDPLATGLLIVLVGKKFTKQQNLYLKQDKSYLCTARIGISTDTYDIEGNTTKESAWERCLEVTETKLKSIIKEFLGETQQTVPPFSSVKIKGKKLYELARKGEKITLPVRTINISNLELVSLDIDTNNKTITFSIDVSCGSGTYIRSLVHDIGIKLKTGATVHSLRRTKIGDISINDAKTIDEIKKKFNTNNQQQE